MPVLFPSRGVETPHMPDQTAPEPEFLTVPELAALLRLKERKIYDLAASGEVPCSRATGKLLFPAREIRAWIDGAKTGGQPAPTQRPAILLGSHDPLLDWAVRHSQCRLATDCDGSLDGLHRFRQGEGVAAGLHLQDSDGTGWNREAAAEHARSLNAVLIGFARRRRGLMFRQDGAQIATLSDLVGLRFAPRQPASGTDHLMRGLLARAGLSEADLTLAEIARSEDDAADSVRAGEADAALGLEAVARSSGLGFAPLIEEEFALLVDRKAWFDAPMQALMAFCASPRFAERANASGGYNLSPLGQVLWNGD